MSTTLVSPATRPADLTRYYGVHNAMRASNVLLVAGLAERPNHRRARALARWFAGYAGELRSHHEVEDDAILPALAARVAAYAPHHDTIAADHHRVDELLLQIGRGLEELTSATGAAAERAHTSALAGAVELRDLLAAHLDLEDFDVLPLIERHFTYEEYEVLDQAALKRLSLKQLRFTIPWFMAMLPADVAAAARADAPVALLAIWRLHRGGYARLTRAAFGPTATAPR